MAGRNVWGTKRNRWGGQSSEGGGGQTIQVSTLPTASASESGKIYQYVGDTTADCTNGYFYKCVSDGGSYSWQVVDVDNSVPFSGVTGSPADNAALAAALNGKADATDLTAHTGDTAIHVTAADKTAWNTKMMSLDFGQNEDTINVVNVFGAVNITEVVTNGNVATIKLSHGSSVRQTVTPGTQASPIAIAAGETMIWDITRTTANTAAALGIKFTIGG